MTTPLAGEQAQMTGVMRIRFLPASDGEVPGEQLLARLDGPQAVRAMLGPMPETHDRAASIEELVVLVVLPRDLPRAEEWIAEGAADARVLRAKTQGGGWVLWRPGRAAVAAEPTQAPELLAALAEFSFYEGQLRRLEREIAEQWPTAQTDMPMAHHVDRHSLRHYQSVGQITRRVLGWRIDYARLERRLLAPADDSPATVRRLGARLRDDAQVESRAAAVSDQIEVYEDIYELVNQRMGEYRNFRQEYIAEVVIIVLLALEVVLMALETGVHHFFQ